jgi:plastocyanin
LSGGTTVAEVECEETDADKMTASQNWHHAVFERIARQCNEGKVTTQLPFAASKRHIRDDKEIEHLVVRGEDKNMATRPSNSKWQRKKAASQVIARAGAISVFVFLALWLNAASAATVTVLVGNSGFNFSPSSVTIHSGDTVQWNFSSSGHSTTSGTPGNPNGLWDSGIRGQGATFSRTFNTVGSFPYFCTPHGQCCGMTGTVNVTAGTPTPTPTPGGNPPTDFNRDGKADYLLYNAGTRRTAVWYLNNNVFIGGAFAPTLPVGWRVIDVADFNRDGKADYALFNASTRQTAIWYLSGVTLIGSATGPTPPVGWALVATGDFNNDGKPDYVLYNASTRQTAVWYLNNNVFIGGANGPTLPAGWSLVGIADFNRDGKRDYPLFNATTRQTAIWYLSGTTRIGSAFGPTIAAGYNLVGATDFNRDGKPDYLLFNPGTRGTALWFLSNNVRIATAFGPTLTAGYTLAAP